MRPTVLVLSLVLAATVAAARPARAPVYEPDLGVDPCFLSTALEADMGLAPGRHRTWYLPSHRTAGPRGRGRSVYRIGDLRVLALAPRHAGSRTRWLDLPAGRSPGARYGDSMGNRSVRLLRVDRDHDEPFDPDFEAGLLRVHELKAVADVELRGGRPVRAALAYWRQVLRDPDDAMAYLGLSDALLLLDNLDFAGESAREGLRAAPALFRARIDKRGFLDDPAPLEEAVESLRREMERVQGSAYERFLLGYNLLFTGRPAEAVEHLEAAAEAWPWDPVPRMALRAARERAGS